MSKQQLDLSIGSRPSLFEGERDDLLICCASYESRSLTGLRCLHKSYRGTNGLVYVNDELARSDRTTRLNLYSLIDGLARRSDAVHVAEGSLFNARAQLDAFKTAFASICTDESTIRTVTLDATTFNRESLLVLCGLLASREPRPKVRILYTSPLKHGDWLSRGVRKVRNVLGFAGSRDPQLPTALVLLSGFEGERAVKIIDEHEPTKLFFGIGDPPTARDFLARNISEQQLALSRQDVEQFKFPASDLDGAFQSVSSIVESCSGVFNVVLAPMSTKLSTLAVLRLAVEQPDVQITYCVPGEYNTVDYSTGERCLYIDDLFV